MKSIQRLVVNALVMLTPALVFAAERTIEIKPLSNAKILASSALQGFEALCFMYILYRGALAGTAYADGAPHSREAVKNAIIGGCITAGFAGVLEVIRQTFVLRGH
jgi:hypothetical protein